MLGVLSWFQTECSEYAEGRQKSCLCLVYYGMQSFGGQKVIFALLSCEEGEPHDDRNHIVRDASHFLIRKRLSCFLLHSNQPKNGREPNHKNNFLPMRLEKFLNNENSRECPVCGLYSFHLKDDLYMHKFECCFKCYIQYVEGREERWKTGWRPNK